MWQEITTLSEIDTVLVGTLLAKENPEENVDLDIYRVTGKTDDSISINPTVSNDFGESFTMQSDELFSKGWWMLKED